MVVNASVPSLVADLLSLAIRGVEAMRRASIVEVRVSGLDSTLLSTSTRIGELEPGLPSKTSEVNAATG